MLARHQGVPDRPAPPACFPLVAALCLVIVRGVVDPLPASAQAGRLDQRVVQTDDDWQIYTTFYYPGGSEKEASTKEYPVIVLLHGDKENRLVFEGVKGLAARLQAEHFAVITVDLRKHRGQSTNVPRAGGDGTVAAKAGPSNIGAPDYQDMVRFDLEAVKNFIYEQHQAKRLNMNKMAIVAAESTTAVALYYALYDWSKDPYDDAPSVETRTPRGHDVRALVLLSPPQRVKGLPLGDVVTEIRNPDWNIAVLTLYGARNKSDARDAEILRRKLLGNAKGSDVRFYFKGFDFNLRGTDLLGKKEVDAESIIVAFLKKHLAELKDSAWRDRQSRLATK